MKQYRKPQLEYFVLAAQSALAFGFDGFGTITTFGSAPIQSYNYFSGSRA